MGMGLYFSTCYTAQKTLGAKHTSLLRWAALSYIHVGKCFHQATGWMLTMPTPSSSKGHNSYTSQTPLQFRATCGWTLANEIWAECYMPLAGLAHEIIPHMCPPLPPLFWRLEVEAPLEGSKVWQRIEQKWMSARNKLLFGYPWYLQVNIVVNLRWPISREHWCGRYNFGWSIMTVNCADWRHCFLSPFQNLLSTVNAWRVDRSLSKTVRICQGCGYKNCGRPPKRRRMINTKRENLGVLRTIKDLVVSQVLHSPFWKSSSIPMPLITSCDSTR